MRRDGHKQKVLASLFRIDKSIISEICAGKRWKHVKEEGVTNER
jgi:hypothetical protein